MDLPATTRGMFPAIIKAQTDEFKTDLPSWSLFEVYLGPIVAIGGDRPTMATAWKEGPPTNRAFEVRLSLSGPMGQRTEHTERWLYLPTPGRLERIHDRERDDSQTSCQSPNVYLKL